MELADCDIEHWPPSYQRRGGQQVLDTRTGVIVLHRPTGIAVVSVDGRSQHANKVTAIAKLRELVDLSRECENLRGRAAMLRDLLIEMIATHVALRDQVRDQVAQ